MVNASYDRIFRIIKEIKGFTLQDYPSNLYEIMLAFDRMQYFKQYGIQIVEQLIDKTNLPLIIIVSEGRSSPKFIVASNKIAYNCLDILNVMVESICNKAFVDQLQPCEQLKLLSSINDIRNALNKIRTLFMTPETTKVHKDMENMLSVVEEYLNHLAPIL